MRGAWIHHSIPPAIRHPAIKQSTASSSFPDYG
jgi:hypothetical protein